jgi:hypothetical protein
VTRKLEEVSAATVKVAVGMTIAVGHPVAELVGRILYSVLQLRRQRRVAHTVRLRGRDVVAIVGSCGIHGGRSVARGDGTSAGIGCD